jgi:hypothetical protein
MVEPTIKAKLVLSTSGGMAGAIGGGDSSSNGSLGKTLTDRLTIPVTDILSSIARGIGVLVRASPVLSATMKEFGFGIRMALMPIAETVSTLLRPWILKFNRIAFKFYEDYLNGGLINAIKKAFTGEDAGAVIGGTAGILGTIIIGGALLKAGISSAMGMIGRALGFGVGTAAGGAAAGGVMKALLIPAAIALAAFGLGKAFGHSNFSSGLLAVIATGAYLLGGMITIPVTLAALLVMETAEASQKKFKSWAESVGLVNPVFDNGITADALVDVILNPEKGRDRALTRDFLQDDTQTIEELQNTPQVGGVFGERKDYSSFGKFGAVDSKIADQIKDINSQYGTIPLTAEDVAKDAEKRSIPIWTRMKDAFIGLITGGANKNAYTGENVGGDSSMAGAISTLGNSTVVMSEETMIPAFQRIGEEIDSEIAKVSILNTDVVDLPDIDRQITYWVQYKKGSKPSGS